MADYKTLVAIESASRISFVTGRPRGQEWATTRDRPYHGRTVVQKGSIVVTIPDGCPVKVA